MSAYQSRKRSRPDKRVNGASRCVAECRESRLLLSMTGVEGHFYTQQFWQGTPVATNLDAIDGSFPTGNPNVAGFNPVNNANWSAIFTGKVQTDLAGVYTFISNTD